MATLAERMDTAEDRLDRLERLAEIHGAFVTRFEEKVDRYIERAAKEREEDRQEAARHREEADRRREKGREEADRERREMNRRRVVLAVRMGTLVEDFVGPSVRCMAREIFDCGDEVFFACRLTCTRSDDRSRRRGFDGLCVGTRGVVLNETNSAPDSRDVRDFVRFFESGEFFLYFPEYRDLPVVPVFSSLNLPKNLVTMLTRHGIYALAMGDEAMQLLNLDEVRARRASDGPAR